MLRRRSRPHAWHARVAPTRRSLAALLAVRVSVASSAPRARRHRSRAPRADTAIAQTCTGATRACAALAVSFASPDRRDRRRVALAAMHRTRAWACVCYAHQALTKTRAMPQLVSAVSLATSVRSAAVSSCLPPAHQERMGTPPTQMATQIASAAHQASRARAARLSRSRAVRAPLRVHLGWLHASHALVALFSRSERPLAATSASPAPFASRVALRRCRARVAPTRTQPASLVEQSADGARSGTHVARAALRQHRAAQAHTLRLRASLHA